MTKIEVVSGDGLTAIIMSIDDAHSLARELHERTYFDEDGNNIVYRLYEALVPTEEVE